MTAPITKYEVLIADTALELEEWMTHTIEHGWEPVGGLAIGHIARGEKYERSEAPDRYAQAIVKRENG